MAGRNINDINRVVVYDFYHGIRHAMAKMAKYPQVQINFDYVINQILGHAAHVADIETISAFWDRMSCELADDYNLDVDPDEIGEYFTPLKLDVIHMLQTNQMYDPSGTHYFRLMAWYGPSVAAFVRDEALYKSAQFENMAIATRRAFKGSHHPTA